MVERLAQAIFQHGGHAAQTELPLQSPACLSRVVRIIDLVENAGRARFHHPIRDRNDTDLSNQVILLLRGDLLQTARRCSDRVRRVRKNRPALFRGRHFEDEIILLCVRWYLRYSLSYRDLEEMMAERGLAVDHSTVWRWVQHYAPMLNRRLRRELRHPNRSWRVDETYIRVAGKWTYLYRAVDSEGSYRFYAVAVPGPDHG